MPPGPRRSPLIVALDYPEASQALDMARGLDPDLCRVKVGLELYTRAGPAILEALQQLGFEVFLDLKLHDIPRTVGRACRVAADLGVWMVNVHALGGRRMLEAAREALERGRTRRPLLTAVTLLTSMDSDDLEGLGLPGSPESWVARLAALSAETGLDGVVCSAREASDLRRRCPAGFLLVTPGIRLPGSASDDQRRIATPGDALRDGANFLVIGRPVTGARNPVGVLRTLCGELAENR